ncbi:hypothetical protein D9M70_478380 [compost metagenome]
MQGIEADDRHPLLLEDVADFLVDVTPAAVTRIDHRHRIARRLGVENGQRQAERVAGVAFAVDDIREMVGQCREGIIVTVFLIDIRMLCDKRGHMRAPIRGGCRREDDGDRVRQGTIGQAIDHAVAFLHLIGRSAELFPERDALLRIDRQRLADRGWRRLGGNRERHGATGADTGNDRQLVGIAADGALYLLAERFDIGDHVDAVAVILGERREISLEIDTDDDGLVTGERISDRLLLVRPA